MQRIIEKISGMIVLALSVKVEGKPKHFMINMSENGQFYFESHYEKTSHRLITYHMYVKRKLQKVCIFLYPHKMRHDKFMSEPFIRQQFVIFRSNKVPVASSTPAYLKRPIERSPWMINHDSIVIVKKLGEGTIDREKKQPIVEILQ